MIHSTLEPCRLVPAGAVMPIVRYWFVVSLMTNAAPVVALFG